MAQGRKGTEDVRYDERVAAELLKALKLGMLLQDAAAFAGMTRETLYKWRTVGKGKPEGHPLRDFADAVSKARMSAKLHAVGRVTAAMAEDWKAAAWWLGVTDPANYGPQVKVTLEAEFRAALERVQKALPRGVYEQVRNAIIADGGHGPEGA